MLRFAAATAGSEAAIPSSLSAKGTATGPGRPPTAAGALL
jgi:hypothetical protein